MKKILAILLLAGVFIIASGSTSAQQKPIIKSTADTSGTKLKAPQKQTRKQKVEVKKTNYQDPKLLKREPWQGPVLLKKENEKQSDHKKKE